MYRCCEKIPFLWQVHVLRGIYTLKCWFFIREGRQFFPLNSFKPTRCLDHWRHLLVGTNHFGWLRLVPMTDHSRSMQAQKVKKHVNSELLQDLLIWNRILQVMTIESFEVHMFTFMFPQKGVNRSKHLNKLGGVWSLPVHAALNPGTKRWTNLRLKCMVRRRALDAIFDLKIQRFIQVFFWKRKAIWIVWGVFWFWGKFCLVPTWWWKCGVDNL